jgi:hypothetical protein
MRLVDLVNVVKLRRELAVMRRRCLEAEARADYYQWLCREQSKAQHPSDQ